MTTSDSPTRRLNQLQGRHYKTKRPPSRAQNLTNSTLLLVSLNGTSYLTTFLRERFLFQHAYGTHVLDRLEVLVSTLAIASNVAGLVLSFLWISGRVRPALTFRLALALAAVAGLLALVSPAVGEALGIAVGSSLFLLACQWAAAQGRQAYALLGAVTAVVPTLLVWESLGTKSAPTILAGYLAGTAWQAGCALTAAAGAVPAPSSGAASSAWWPMIYTSAIQVDALADQAVLLRAGPGWASADALSYNFFVAAVVTVVSPLSSQALAGRLHLRERRWYLALAVGMALAFIAVVLIGLGPIVGGGALGSSGVHRLRNLSLSYGVAIPFAIYWQGHTRAGHRDAASWRRIAMTALALLSVHLVTLVPLVALSQWAFIPLATALSFAVVAVSWARKSRQTRRQHHTVPG